MVITEGIADPWFLSGVYASTDFRERRGLWSELLSLLGQGFPSIIAGDFNCIIGANEKKGGRQVTGSVEISEFRSFISSAGLMDLGFSGPQFTWCNNRQGSARVWERLDRAMATSQWLHMYPSVTVTHLPRIGSDHCPILISTEVGARQQRQFRFEQFWTSYSSARSIISHVWHLPVRGNASYRLSRRLELARRRLSSWNRRVVGDLVRNVEQVEADISTLQSREDQDGFLSDTDLASLRAKLALHHSLLQQQETYWRQRSRIQWICHGDRNTRFFHQTTLKRRAANRIRRIVDDDGHLQEDIGVIRNHFFHYFHSRWTEQTGHGGPVFHVLQSKKVSAQENALLVRPITAEEIRLALWDLGPDKAPGPDGFPPFFFRYYWDIVGQEVIQAIQIAFQSKSIPAEWNRTLITLVPKRADASIPQHYRPISLCTTLYKVCARLLANRLRDVIPRLISAEQGAFIKGRCISDNVLIAQEFMHDLQRASARQCLMAVKLDMERAYDRLSWDFLHCTLQEFGFHDLFIDWILACIQRPSFSLIINGALTDFFHSAVGLRQGCPLSPFLFILAADDLSRALYQAQQDRHISPFMAGPRGPSVCHLMFADDCILLGPATVRNAASFAGLLQRYCQASGQKVNLHKSSICFSPKTTSSSREAIHITLGISTKVDRLSYLGIPITGRRPRIGDYSVIERRVRDRIDGWHVSGLSMMARITLIRSVLTSLPLHLLSNAAIPISCLKRIERCIRDFLWASMQDGHGMHLLAWDTVCMPIHEGGLGIQSLLVRREALTARHASRFILEPHCLWSSFMRARYGDWVSSAVPQPSRGCSFFWKEVCRYAPTVLNDTSWMIGDGSSIDVIQDSWIADIPLSRWPTFISSDVPPSMRVKDLISPDFSSWHTSTVTCLFGDELSRRILSIPLLPGSFADTRLWRRSCLSRAPTRDLMKAFRPQPRCRRDAAWIWKLHIHPRVQLFIWKLLWDCLPTCALLSSRGLAIQALCPLCGQEDETSDHALFICPRARWIWQRMGYRFSEDGMGSLRLSFLDNLRRATLQQASLWAVTAYQIWLSRNQLIFTDETISSLRVIRKIRSQSAEFALHCHAVDSDTSGHWGSPAASAAIRHTVFISWEPPPPGSVKINFDGSVCGRLAGSAFVIRGYDGALLAMGGFGSLDSSVPMAELYAAWAGIAYAARSLHAHSLLIEGDSLTVVRWIRKESCNLAPINPLLHDIWSLLREVPSAQIRHIYREANSAADWVAAYVARHTGFWIWHQGDPCPVVLKQILYSDISGLTRTRVV